MALPVSAAVQDDIYDLAFQGLHDVPMMFFPQAWNAAPNMPMVWSQSEFPPNPRSGIPKQPGVYVFVVMNDLFGFPHGNGLFYIGKATNLYERVGAYLGDVDLRLLRTKRPLVWRMLNQWNGHLKYFYTTTPNKSAAKKLEGHMIEAFRPPFNRQYEGSTSKTMRAFI
jgi:hypothetical protein